MLRLTCGRDALAGREPRGGDHGGQREGEAGGEGEQDGADVTHPAGDTSAVSPMCSHLSDSNVLDNVLYRNL